MIDAIFEWFLDMQNSKVLSLLILFVTFTAITIYVYGSKKRSKRLESYRDIPFRDEDPSLIPHAKKEKSNNDGK